MTASSSRFSLPALAVMAGLASFVTTPLAAQAVSNSVEFEAWRKVQKGDIDGLGENSWRWPRWYPPASSAGGRWKEPGPSTTYSPMSPRRGTPRRRCSVENSRRVHLPTSTRGGPARQASGRSTDRGHGQVDAEPERHAGRAFADKVNTPITYYGQPTLPRIATTYTLNDLHEHLGQLVSYARMNQIVPPWSKKPG